MIGNILMIKKIFKVDFYAYWNRLDSAVFLVQALIFYLIIFISVIFRLDDINDNIKEA